MSAKRDAAFIRAQRRQVQALEKVLRTELADSFNKLGERAEDIYLRITAGEPDPEPKGTKRTDKQLADQIAKDLKLSEWKATNVKAPMERHYVRTGRASADLANSHYSLGVGLPAPAERALLRRGGTRAGLVDIDGDTRKAILRGVTDGRTEMLGHKEIARRIRQYVPSGRYTNLAMQVLADGSNRGAYYRAQMIARAESKTAQNYSTLLVYGGAPNVTAVEAVDARIGDEHDEECVARDGQVFTLEEAEGEDLTHPNCSLSWTPIIADAVVDT